MRLLHQRSRGAGQGRIDIGRDDQQHGRHGRDRRRRQLHDVELGQHHDVIERRIGRRDVVVIVVGLIDLVDVIDLVDLVDVVELERLAAPLHEQ